VSYRFASCKGKVAREDGDGERYSGGGGLVLAMGSTALESLNGPCVISDL
jgi:hypothetical protein